jgi:hypothetical protein
VKRYSGQVVPNEAVRVTEVETGMDQGEEFGFTVHYVERADGSYVIYDHLPFEIMPLLKNDLTVGSTWNYQDQYGQITWTVLDMGVNLDLEFTVFEDCRRSMRWPISTPSPIMHPGTAAFWSQTPVGL